MNLTFKSRRIWFLFAAAAGILFWSLWFFHNRPIPISKLELVSNFTWRIPNDDRFGGFSGFELDPSGSGFVALSDYPILYKGSVKRNPDDQIESIDLISKTRLVSDLGKYIDTLNGDTEGLAMSADGGLHVTLERHHALNYIYPESDAVVWINRPAEFASIPPNLGFEALAITDEGHLLLFQEDWPDETTSPVFKYDGTVWSNPYTLERRGSYRPVGADIGPDGRLYLLERVFVPLIGFSSQIRSFGLENASIGDERILLRSPLRTFDNLEGLSVWRATDGSIRITAISDDNFNWFQKTQIIEFGLPN